MRHHITEHERRTFEGGRWSWKATRQGFMLQLPGPTFVYVVPAPTENGWTAYEATATGLHVLAEQQPLSSARCIGEITALGAILARKEPEPERQP